MRETGRTGRLFRVRCALGIARLSASIKAVSSCELPRWSPFSTPSGTTVSRCESWVAVVVISDVGATESEAPLSVGLLASF